jgi:hypothetical protein
VSRPHWEDRPTDLSEGDYFGALGPEGQRDELAKRWIVTAYRATLGPVRAPVVALIRKDLAA